MSTAAKVPESKKDALALIVKTKDDTIKNFLIGALGLDPSLFVSLGRLCNVKDRVPRRALLLVSLWCCQAHPWYLICDVTAARFAV